ncbi:hypothetical protein [Aestuariivirga sp.]|uniref:hypothetical protein n=1 Tax=Aestuariivirga sp. TaxID=2650926 RepID=UPI003918D78F
MGERSYPGDHASLGEIHRLAEHYRSAAAHLLKLGQAGDPLSRAPFRLCAIHAIELYLNALLLHLGHDPASIRGLQHDLKTRADLAVQRGLQLRKRTETHLKEMVDTREYLVTRYGPEKTTQLPQINRLEATLGEIANKVSQMIGPRA